MVGYFQIQRSQNSMEIQNHVLILTPKIPLYANLFIVLATVNSLMLFTNISPLMLHKD